MRAVKACYTIWYINVIFCCCSNVIFAKRTKARNEKAIIAFSLKRFIDGAKGGMKFVMIGIPPNKLGAKQRRSCCMMRKWLVNIYSY
jgi:hypothetical protein